MTIPRKNLSTEAALSLCSPPVQINSLWSDSRQVEERMKKDDDGEEDGASDGGNEWRLKMVKIVQGYTDGCGNQRK